MALCIWTAIYGVFGIACLVIGILQFCEKGFVFHNAYIFASERERADMNKKPYYRYSAIIFTLSAALFFGMGVECVLLTNWLWLLIGALAGAILVIAIACEPKRD